jgi:polar amino acid transport system substrate-binding protein
MTAILGLLLSGYAGISTAPTPEARQALAPTGKLRVGLQLGNPLNATRDSVSGEMKGLGFDLGKELARRIEVPFEPVLYPSIGALLDSGKSGAWDVSHFGFTPERATEFDFAAVHLEVEFGYLVPGGLPSRQWLKWIAPGFESPCKRSPARTSFSLAR